MHPGSSSHDFATRLCKLRTTRTVKRRSCVADLEMQASRWSTYNRLAAAPEVEPRTIRRDIEFMRDRINAPVAFDRGRGGYYLAGLTFRLGWHRQHQQRIIGRPAIGYQLGRVAFRAGVPGTPYIILLGFRGRQVPGTPYIILLGFRGRQVPGTGSGDAIHNSAP